MSLSHLSSLEAESVHILREMVAESAKPVMLYSAGKDSSVLVHLAMKAFFPTKPPFPLLRVDTGWKFREMIAFRDRRIVKLGLQLIVYTNEEGRKEGISPILHGSEIHSDLMKTQALRRALEQYGFDAAFGGARRDEEISRAKERIVSLRTARHHWDPKQQRPELWRVYNMRKNIGESLRVFPLSNWTELDIWLYIQREDIPVVPLYFAAPRPVVQRRGALIMVDDDRLPVEPGEPEMRWVRFRTLGCYPLTGAVESKATSVAQIIEEVASARDSERSDRLIDHDAAAPIGNKEAGRLFLISSLVPGRAGHVAIQATSRSGISRWRWSWSPAWQIGAEMPRDEPLQGDNI
jgi:sulfate adenylyltransferase subunit 2